MASIFVILLLISTLKVSTDKTNKLVEKFVSSLSVFYTNEKGIKDSEKCDKCPGICGHNKKITNPYDEKIKFSKLPIISPNDIFRAVGSVEEIPMSKIKGEVFGKENGANCKFTIMKNERAFPKSLKNIGKIGVNIYIFPYEKIINWDGKSAKEFDKYYMNFDENTMEAAKQYIKSAPYNSRILIGFCGFENEFTDEYGYTGERLERLTAVQNFNSFLKSIGITDTNGNDFNPQVVFSDDSANKYGAVLLLAKNNVNMGDSTIKNVKILNINVGSSSNPAVINSLFFPDLVSANKEAMAKGNLLSVSNIAMKGKTIDEISFPLTQINAIKNDRLYNFSKFTLKPMQINMYLTFTADQNNSWVFLTQDNKQKQNVYEKTKGIKNTNDWTTYLLNEEPTYWELEPYYKNGLEGYVYIKTFEQMNISKRPQYYLGCDNRGDVYATLNKGLRGTIWKPKQKNGMYSFQSVQTKKYLSYQQQGAYLSNTRQKAIMSNEEVLWSAQFVDGTIKNPYFSEIFSSPLKYNQFAGMSYFPNNSEDYKQIALFPFNGQGPWSEAVAKVWEGSYTYGKSIQNNSYLEIRFRNKKTGDAIVLMDGKKWEMKPMGTNILLSKSKPSDPLGELFLKMKIVDLNANGGKMSDSKIQFVGRLNTSLGIKSICGKPENLDSYCVKNFDASKKVKEDFQNINASITTDALNNQDQGAINPSSAQNTAKIDANNIMWFSNNSGFGESTGTISANDFCRCNTQIKQRFPNAKGSKAFQMKKDGKIIPVDTIFEEGYPGMVEVGCIAINKDSPNNFLETCPVCNALKKSQLNEGDTVYKPIKTFDSFFGGKEQQCYPLSFTDFQGNTQEYNVTQQYRCAQGLIESSWNHQCTTEEGLKNYNAGWSNNCPSNYSVSNKGYYCEPDKSINCPNPIPAEGFAIGNVIKVNPQKCTTNIQWNYILITSAPDGSTQNNSLSRGVNPRYDQLYFGTQEPNGEFSNPLSDTINLQSTLPISQITKGCPVSSNTEQLREGDLVMMENFDTKRTKCQGLNLNLYGKIVSLNKDCTANILWKSMQLEDFSKLNMNQFKDPSSYILGCLPSRGAFKYAGKEVVSLISNMFLKFMIKNTYNTSNNQIINANKNGSLTMSNVPQQFKKDLMNSSNKKVIELNTVDKAIENHVYTKDKRNFIVEDIFMGKIKQTIGKSMKLDNLDNRVFGTPIENPNADSNLSLNIRSVNVPLALLKKTPEINFMQNDQIEFTVFIKEDKEMKKGTINGIIEKLDLSGNYANIKMNSINYGGKTYRNIDETNEVIKKLFKIPGEFNFIIDTNNFYTVTNVPLSMLRKPKNSSFSLF